MFKDTAFNTLVLVFETVSPGEKLCFQETLHGTRERGMYAHEIARCIMTTDFSFLKYLQAR